MRTHTSEFKDIVKKFGREIDSLITYTTNNEEIELGNEQLNSVSIHYEGAILKSVMKQLDIDSNVEIPVGTILNYQFGVKVRDNEVIDYRANYDYIDYGNFIVKEVEKQEDTNSYKITCYDKMLYAMVDYEDLNITYPITITNYINAICTHLGLTFSNVGSSFANYNRQIQNELYLDSGGNSLNYTFRDVLDELATATGSTICINEDDELEIRYITNTYDTIDEEYLKDINVNFGEKYGPINSIVLSRSAESDNVYLQDAQSIATNGLCELKIIDNQIMNWNDRSDYLPDLLGKLNGLEYYINDFSSPGICYYDLCDRYSISVSENTYSCVMLNDEINITQGIEENIYTKMPDESETDYTKSDKTDRKINQTYLIVDKQNQTIEGVVSQVSDQNEQIATIRLQYNELLSRISDIADITTSAEDTDASVSLENINASQPINIKIHPISENIRCLYPYSALYPSSATYLLSRTLRFTNTSTNEVFDWVLPTDLWYYDSNNYDTLELSYGDGTNSSVIVSRKCKINANNTVSVLTTPTTETYAYPSSLVLTDGNYTVQLLTHSYGYLYVQLMASNIYTTQFATKVEMNSAISQTANEINLRVNEKLDNEDFTHAEIVAKINDDTSQVKIYADKINLQGYVMATDLSGTGTTTINGSNITTGVIKSSNYQANTSGTKIDLSDGSIDTNGFKVSSTGDLTASTGNIAGWQILSDRLKKTAGNYNIELLADTQTDGAKFLVWDTANSRFNFYVNGDGKLYARNCEINGYVNATSGNFTGNVNATSGSFSGSLYSSSGTIGGWTLSSSKLYGQSSHDGRTYSLGRDGVENGYQTYWWGNLFPGSDKRLKNNIKNIDDKFDQFYDSLKPVSFYFNKGVSDDKKHFGFIAQDVEKSQEEINEDLSMLEKPGDNKYYSLYKDEIIALNTWQIQKLKEEVKLLKEEINELKEIIKDGNMQKN